MGEPAMMPGFRQSMAWLHTWSGLLLGWLLYAVFFTGTTAYFNQEITAWMTPESVEQADPRTAAVNAQAWLARHHPDAVTWDVMLPASRGGETRLSWTEASSPTASDAARGSMRLNGRGLDTPVPRPTAGGQFLYGFHYELHYVPYRTARWIVGLSAMFMLVAIVSGIVTHKKIFADFFMLRFGKGQRSWLDAHNVTAVLALPFHLMITYTGLVALMHMYMPWPDMMRPKPPRFAPMTIEASAAPSAPLTALLPLLTQASQEWGGVQAVRIKYQHPGHADARITLFPSGADSIAEHHGAQIFDGATGALITPPPSTSNTHIVESAMVGLHAGRYAAPTLRWLYFLSGLGGTVMIGTGLLLWIVKRRQRLPDPEHPYFGFRIVERLNIGTIVGLPAGVAAYFLANRLLSTDAVGRADWEIRCLFITWTALLVWSIVRPAKSAWVEALTVCALLYALVPIVSALTTTRGLFSSLITRDWVFVSFDLVMLITAALLTLAVRKLASHTPKAAPRRKPRPSVEAAA
ncbi:PepSY-associated TM helix domain-containing protein [Novosphingobium resinovorum]|uniref:PepSY-associated TM helix domain-containing protein n=1 Tax=Novosphingobium resinovorum TaxID=158500 RepID=UPI002ECFDC6B|nr:PepSY-associated TM helix domain-containing protein [Novosphingobium resinovorum]